MQCEFQLLNENSFTPTSMSNAFFNTESQQIFSTIGFESPFQQLLQQQKQILQQFNKQNKWQLWLSDRPMLKRAWLNMAGLDRQKVIHLTNINRANLITTVEKALLSGNCSYVVACINHLTHQEKQRLQQAVLKSGTHLFLVESETN